MESGKKKIIESISSLLSIRCLDYVLALLIVPYLLRTIGIERYGAISLANGIVTYFLYIVDYSFPLTAPRDIALWVANGKKRDIFSSILCAKVLLLLLSLFLFLGMVFFIPFFLIDRDIYLVAFLKVLGGVLFPIWFFQGIEKMRYITYATTIARLLTIICIFIWVKTPLDTELAVFFQSIATIIAGIISFYILLKKYSFIFVMPKISSVKEQFVQGFRIFYSNLAVNLYTGSNVVFLGLLTNNTLVGCFSTAQQLMQVLKSVVDTISIALFPRSNAILASSFKEAVSFWQQSLKYLGSLGLCLSVLGFVFADYAVFLVLGRYEVEISSMFRVLCWIPFIVAFTGIYLNHIIIACGKEYLYSKIIFRGMFTNLLIVFPLINFYGGIGVAISMLLAELVVALYSVYLVEKEGIHIIKK